MLMDVILNVVACSLVVYQQYLKFNMSRMNASSFLHKHIHVSLLPILVKKKKSILMQSFHYFQILSTTKFYRSVLPLNVTRHKLSAYHCHCSGLHVGLPSQNHIILQSQIIHNVQFILTQKW